MTFPKLSTVPSKGSAVFLKNGHIGTVVNDCDDDSFRAFFQSVDSELLFSNRSSAGAHGPYMPARPEWPSEKLENWKVMYFIEPYSSPHVFKTGDEGRTESGYNYHVIRVDSTNVTAAIWRNGEWVTLVNYYSKDGQYQKGGGDDRSNILPPSKA